MRERLSEWSEKYRGKLVRDLTGRFRSLSTDDAQDLVQDVFLELQKKSPQIRDGSEWLYLRTAVRRRALNLFRAREAQVRNESSAPERAHPPGADDELIRREATASAKARAGAAIRALPELTRQCVLLYLRDMSGAEIARTVGLTEVAVRSRLHDAKQRLRASVGELPDWIDWPELAEGTE